MNVIVRHIIRHISLLGRTSVLLFLFLPHFSYGNTLKITIISSSNSIIYTKAIKNIKEVLNDDNNNQFSIETIPVSSIKDLNNPLDSKNNLLVTVGQLAFEKSINLSDTSPILATLISRNSFYEILKKSNHLTTDPNIGAVFLDQPLKRIIQFTRLALPNRKRLGFLISKEYWDTIPDFELNVKNYSYHLEILENGDNLIRSLNQVMKDADLIIALPDPLIFNRRNTHNILLSTYRKLIPVIGFSSSYIKAGALAGIHSTPDLIGKQTGELINSLSINGQIDKLPRLYSKYFQVSVNHKVARSLGSPTIDEDMLRIELLDKEVNP